MSSTQLYERCDLSPPRRGVISVPRHWDPCNLVKDVHFSIKELLLCSPAQCPIKIPGCQCQLLA
ncbi:hypothetical protein [Wolbachia endosymbiont of Psylliodes chrysocephala]|uniref:hypothetical protein n=1 Tax=Wolbachia endosymbiont of Psylliodes chrysocephala TaxID=2883236 RepID=UPI0020A03485|nr:hypothetical protein [Wolbachia endosymbiont of Psylliodes chrysocephala]